MSSIKTIPQHEVLKLEQKQNNSLQYVATSLQNQPMLHSCNRCCRQHHSLQVYTSNPTSTVATVTIPVGIIVAANNISRHCSADRPKNPHHPAPSTLHKTRLHRVFQSNLPSLVHQISLEHHLAHLSQLCLSRRLITPLGRGKMRF